MMKLVFVLVPTYTLRQHTTGGAIVDVTLLTLRDLQPPLRRPFETCIYIEPSYLNKFYDSGIIRQVDCRDNCHFFFSTNWVSALTVVPL